MIIYTGGTSDRPKGVMLSHGNLVANALQTRHWITDIREGHEAFLCALPFSHSYGLSATLNAPVMIGATMILLPTFITGDVLKTIKREKPTLFPGVPTMYMAINNFRGVRNFGIRSIRACISGAAPLPVEVQEAFEKLTRGRLVEGYGLTEASPITATVVNTAYFKRRIVIPLHVSNICKANDRPHKRHNQRCPNTRKQPRALSRGIVGNFGPVLQMIGLRDIYATPPRRMVNLTPILKIF